MLDGAARKPTIKPPMILVMVKQCYVWVRVLQSLVLEGADLQPLAEVMVNRSTVWVGMRMRDHLSSVVLMARMAITQWVPKNAFLEENVMGCLWVSPVWGWSPS